VETGPAPSAYELEAASSSRKCRLPKICINCVFRRRGTQVNLPKIEYQTESLPVLAMNWKQPEYAAIFRARLENLEKLREHPERLPELKTYYAAHPADFINDWGVTHDPRNADVGLPTLIPFILFPRQREWIDWVIDRWKNRRPGLCEKSRDMGVSWLALSLSCTLCLFNDGVAIGFGSRKTEYVDKIGTFKPLLPKGRMFMEHLPEEFRGGFVPWRDAPYMRITFPETGSIIAGEGGDDIGRGDRTTLYFFDEEAHHPRQELVAAALSQTTNCQIGMSSVRGMNNLFAQKRWGGKIDVFIFDWRAQPLDAKLLTPCGWTNMGDISKGDYVIGQNGLPTEVIGVYPQGRKEIYKISFNDGSSTESCSDHLWEVIPVGNQRAERRHIRRVMPLREIMKDYVRIDNRGFRQHRYQVPLTMPVRGFQQSTLPLDAYVLGCLLGDGSLPAKSTSAIGLSIGKTDTQIVDLINARLPTGCDVKQDKEIQFRISANRYYRGGTKGRGCHNAVNEAIRTLGLVGTQSNDKFIPEIYKLASVSERLDLLQGLMDTDGHASKSSPGIAILSTVSKQLADDIVYLAQTLGGVGKIRISHPNRMAIFGNRVCRRREVAYAVDICLPNGIIPFKMDRKVAAYKPAVRHPARRSIVGIELMGEKECQCIKIAASDGLYLTDDCIVTHNTDPRKDEAWYERQCEDLDPVIVAQEIDRDYSASIHGVVIPGLWVRAAIDAKKKLGIAPSGKKGVAFDVADEGDDKNAIARCEGTEVVETDEWSGKGGDIFSSTEYVFDVCDENGYTEFRYDADGMGADVRGDARVINERRVKNKARVIRAIGYRGSEGVYDPEGIVEGTIGSEGDAGRTNQDYFGNHKAQSWWSLRKRFQRTYRWVETGVACAPDDIISLNSENPNLMKLVAELSQATYKQNEVGKIIIEKKPAGRKSPNQADAVVIHYAPMEQPPVEITMDMLRQIAQAGAPQRRR
jgi:LAGLIDADG-like domain/Terminase RNAseH like domain